MLRGVCRFSSKRLPASSRLVTRSYAADAEGSSAAAAEKKSDKWRVAVVLSGCGFQDGSEITEAVSTLQHLSRVGAHYDCFAPDMESIDVTDHIKGTSDSDEYRYVLNESARITRGKVGKIADLNVSDFDALIFPGGFGVAKHLSDYYKGSPNWNVLPEVESVINAFHKAKKSMGFICIAPILAARVLGSSANCRLTIGADAKVSKQIESLGAKHSICLVDQTEVDEENLIFSTPAYMFPDSTPFEVYRGIGSLVDAMVKKSAVHQAAQLDPFVEKIMNEFLIPTFTSHQTKGPTKTAGDPAERT